MDNHIPQINGVLLRMRREELGWALADLATRACLSNKQVKQIEEGGTSSFYSDTVKLTAAKKISGILGIPAQSLFVVEEPAPFADAIADQQDSHTPDTDVAPTEPSGQLAVDKTQAEQSASEAHSDCACGCASPCGFISTFDTTYSTIDSACKRSTQCASRSRVSPFIGVCIRVGWFYNALCTNDLNDACNFPS
ncbi:MAG: XRE family transcriptional regulator [Betaproteobacteria bacterium]|nr:XRE family transcriptional regulator [Betaproteobacteria bacterium]